MNPAATLRNVTDGFHAIALLFTLALGACVGSFLNVVVYRLPEIDPAGGFWRSTANVVRGLSHPPSHCPKCGYRLAWFDNVPVLGWLWLRGRCRKCGVRISPQYPIVELFTGLMFAGLYAAFFLGGPAWGPPTPARVVEGVSLPLSEGVLAGNVVVDAAEAGFSSVGRVPTLDLWLRQIANVVEHWPMLAIALTLASCLLVASLIDARLFIIPRELSYLPALVAVPVHAVFDEPFAPMSVMAGPVGCAWAIGGGGGLVVSLLLLRFGRLRRSYGEDVDPTTAGRGQTTREMLRELAFLAPPVGLGLLLAVLALGPMAGVFESIADVRPASAALGSVLGGLVGGGVIWGVRLLGSLGFGKEAMGLGDVDLMFGVGCCIGAAPAGLAIFPAALVGLVFAVGKLFSRESREIPFGPYLAIASVGLIVGWNHVADYLRPSAEGLAFLLGPIGPLVGL